MEDFQILGYAIGGILLVASFIVYTKFKKIHDLILNTQTSSIATIRKGFYEIKGKVVALNETLRSPLSQKDCVYYYFKVEQESNSGKHSSYRTIIDDKSHVRFAVEDHGGKAIVDIARANLRLNVDLKTKSGILNTPTEDMKAAVERYGKSTKGWFLEKSLRYREVFLEEGDEVYVVGEVQGFEDQYPVFEKCEKPFIVSDKTEERLLKYYKTIYSLCMLVGALAIVGLVVLSFYR